MIDIKNKSDCDGCHACTSVCPKQCVEMHNDEYGFFYPFVDESMCIKCGLCLKVCPILSPCTTKNSFKIEAYAAYNKEPRVREKSSSGGVFTLLASEVIRKNGVVFGAAFDNDLNLGHICVDNESDLQLLRGSKYLQSKIGNAFVEAKGYLDGGRYVMFTGTPCQIAGLKSFLGKEYDNLLTQDFVCHGIPSPKVWERYKSSLEKKHGAKMTDASFRSKKTGWTNYSVSLKFDNNSGYTSRFYNDPYMNAFLLNLSLRDSCYKCQFKSKSSCADITLGDFWGIHSIIPEFDPEDKGSSLVFVNTQNGKDYFDAITDEICTENSFVLSDAIKHNPCIATPVEMPKERVWFFKKANNRSIEDVMKRYRFKKRIEGLFNRFIKCFKEKK